MSTQFRPLLAEVADLSCIKYPLFASVKIDGIRCLIRDGVPVSRKLLPIPNDAIRALLSQPELEGLDGELTIGSPTDEKVFNTTTRTVGKKEKPIGDTFRFWVFDLHNKPEWPFSQRLGALTHLLECFPTPHVELLPQRQIFNEEELLAFEEESVNAGWEGIMIRSPNGPYKYGRSTAKEGTLLKLKRYADSEAEIIGVVEGMTNNNAATKDELGHTKRSSAKAGKTPTGTLGALLGRDLTTGVEFRCGTGMDNDEAARLWAMRDQLPGQVFTYRFQTVGVLNKPRFPSYKGLRTPVDQP